MQTDEIVGTIIRAVHAEFEATSVQAIVTSQRCLERDGFVCPSWEDLATGEVGAAAEEDEDPNQPRAAWPKSRGQDFRTLVGDLHGPAESLVAFTRWTARFSSFHQHADRQGFAHRFSVFQVALLAPSPSASLPHCSLLLMWPSL